MKPDDFTQPQRTACRKMPTGYWAFIPPDLPPQLGVDWPLAKLISEADLAMAELSGEGRLLPNPHLLIRPYLRREAILSSRIENTIAEMKELVLFEVQPDTPPPREDVREVANYVRAMETGLERLGQLPISGRLMCELHRVLLSGVRGGESDKTPGEFRRSQNWIGPPGTTLAEETFVPPPPEEMMAALGSWENYLHADSPEPVLVKCAVLHYQFEAIHPFLDGNGRIGRLLLTLFLCSCGCLSQPLLYLSGFFDETRDEYYRLLLAVSQRGAWREWIEYFLRGVRLQARVALRDTGAVLRLYEERRAQMKEGSRVPKVAARILDEVFGNPVFSIARFCGQTGESFQTVSKGVEYWARRGLLGEATGQKRNRLFIAAELMELMSGTSRTARSTEAPNEQTSS